MAIVGAHRSQKETSASSGRPPIPSVVEPPSGSSSYLMRGEGECVCVGGGKRGKCYTVYTHTHTTHEVDSSPYLAIFSLSCARALFPARDSSLHALSGALCVTSTLNDPSLLYVPLSLFRSRSSRSRSSLSLSLSSLSLCSVSALSLSLLHVRVGVVLRGDVLVLRLLARGGGGRGEEHQAAR